MYLFTICRTDLYIKTLRLSCFFVPEHVVFVFFAHTLVCVNALICEICIIFLINHSRILIYYTSLFHVLANTLVILYKQTRGAHGVKKTKEILVWTKRNLLQVYPS